MFGDVQFTSITEDLNRAKKVTGTYLNSLWKSFRSLWKSEDGRTLGAEKVFFTISLNTLIASIHQKRRKSK